MHLLQGSCCIPTNVRYTLRKKLSAFETKILYLGGTVFCVLVVFDKCINSVLRFKHSVATERTANTGSYSLLAAKPKQCINIAIVSVPLPYRTNLEVCIACIHRYTLGHAGQPGLNGWDTMDSKAVLSMSMDCEFYNAIPNQNALLTCTRQMNQ